jgi:BMFP domain-containing protein YqiC
MTDAGLDEDTANKVMENYKAQSKEMRSKIMKKLKGMMEKPSGK